MARKHIPACVAALLIGGVLPARPQPFDAQSVAALREVVDAIYRLDYARAETLSRQMIEESPEDLSGYVFLARTYWSDELNKKHALSMDRFAAPDFFAEKQERKYTIEVDQAAEERFALVSQQAIDKGKALLDKEPANARVRFLLGLAYQNRATFEASLKGNWWSAFRAGNRTYRYHRRVLASHPQFADPMLAMGVYEYVAGSVPWTVRWLTFLLGHGGSKKKGKEKLETAGEKAVLLAADAQTILALIYTREKSFEKAFEKLSALGEKYPENYLFQLDRGSVARRMDQPDLAVEILNEVLGRIGGGEEGYERLQPSIVYNQLGLAFRDKGDLQASGDWFQKTLREDTAPARAKTIAHLELGKTLDLQNRREEALQHYRMVWDADDVVGSKADARRLMDQKHRANE